MAKKIPSSKIWPADNPVRKKTSELIPYVRNSRTHSADQVAQIAASIKEWGFTNPILIDPDGGIIAGHGRLLAAQLLKIEEVPCIVAEGWTDAQKKAYVIADNKLALNAGWDNEMLKVEIAQLEEMAFDLSLTGFSLDELAAFKPLEEGLTDPDEAPPLTENPKTVPGDLWLLGKHRLFCGDATKIDDIQKVMGGGIADMVFTDPPYRMEAEGGSSQPIGKAARKLGDAIKHLCDFDPKAFLNVLPTVFKKSTLNAYVFCNKDLVPDYLSWAVAAGYSFNILFWKKPNALPLGGSHRPDVEYLLFFRKSAIWNNAIKGASYSKCLEFSRENDTVHPTMKPVAMIENQILLSSKPGGVVVDLFLGSGSTIIAAEKTGRMCYGTELDPRYCDVIIKRWEAFTGKEATHAETGKRFSKR